MSAKNIIIFISRDNDAMLLILLGRSNAGGQYHSRVSLAGGTHPPFESEHTYTI
jgi:hypothetical protein